ncbi:hypothetical protein BCR36DRAFT_585814 [Piromyces finnis]|uniref:BRCT domain-containing protein n=1 Tax=Piromyces finnis TaxID=1754191 RepID=A0A1Y1V1X0_9FUNG|nr:hypothetical protein BCR36DRAFT_585814 [Piromyces finnis]|eukprot:ORX45204.1 hypothetical protein BCR36DRAFT_585814 [Piromyces finnis]
MSLDKKVSGIGPFKFRNKNDLETANFLNSFKDRNYKFEYEPENQEDIQHISNSLFYYNLIEKYTINYSTKTIDTNSQFNYEKLSSSSGYSNTLRDNCKKELNKKELSSQIKTETENTSNKNYSTVNSLRSNKKDTSISKYFSNVNNKNNPLSTLKFPTSQNSNTTVKENLNQNNEKKINNVIKENEINNQSEKENNTPAKISDILKNVKIVISGIQNPEREKIRNLVIEMGAKYEPQWTDSATHLICPIKGTPKYNEVKKQGRGIIVKPEWIYKCYEQKKRLSEKDYSFENQVSDTSSTKNQSTEKVNNTRNFINDNTDSKKEEKDDILNKINNNNDDSANFDKVKKLKQINCILNIPNIFNNLYFFFDKSILEKTRKELERYVLGHGGKILNNINSKVTHYCTMKSSNEIIIPDDITFNGSIINPSYIINCHNQNRVL